MIPLLLFAMAGASTPPPPPTPPVPPVLLTRSYYSGGRIQMDVVLGDAAAYTRLYEAGVLRTTLDPGLTQWSSGSFSLGAMTATHYKNGLESSSIGEGA